MKIAIKFHDNDFINTFYGVLHHLLAAYKHNDSLPTNKEHLCAIINKLSPICYVTHQNLYSYNGLENCNGNLDENEHYNKMVKYLQMTADRILVNEEVDQYLKEFAWNNSEIFILDTDLYNNNVYSI